MTDKVRMFPRSLLVATVAGYQRIHDQSLDADERCDIWRKQAKVNAMIGRMDRANEEQTKAYARHLLKKGKRP